MVEQLPLNGLVVGSTSLGSFLLFPSHRRWFIYLLTFTVLFVNFYGINLKKKRGKKRNARRERDSNQLISQSPVQSPNPLGEPTRSLESTGIYSSQTNTKIRNSNRIRLAETTACHFALTGFEHGSGVQIQYEELDHTHSHISSFCLGTEDVLLSVSLSSSLSVCLSMHCSCRYCTMREYTHKSGRKMNIHCISIFPLHYACANMLFTF